MACSWGIFLSDSQFFFLADRQCKMLVGGQLSQAPQVEMASWASIWSAAVAVNEMCARDGKAGYVKPQSK